MEKLQVALKQAYKVTIMFAIHLFSHNCHKLNILKDILVANLYEDICSWQLGKHLIINNEPDTRWGNYISLKNSDVIKKNSSPFIHLLIPKIPHELNKLG